jgi:endonuclease/exonuclease/phosphatase family metal-dependent hydrolase
VGDQKYEIDKRYPGTVTAATVFVEEVPALLLVGLHLRYRKDAEGNFVGHPASDLKKLKKDLKMLVDANEMPIIVAGDFNFDLEHEEEGFPVPRVLERLATGDRKLQNPFPNGLQGTFQQDWEDGGAFNLDYIFLSMSLADRVTEAKGGFEFFDDALKLSDHVPVLVEVAI